LERAEEKMISLTGQLVCENEAAVIFANISKGDMFLVNNK